MERDGPVHGGSHRPLSDRRTRTVHGILAAAMQAMAQEGIAGLTMSTLAQRAGVSRQTLYNYFPDIDAVLAGLVQAGDEGTAELAARLEAEADPTAALGLFVETVVASVAAGHPSPLALTAALPATLRAAMAAHEEQAQRLVIDIIRRGQAEGAFGPELDPELDGRILYRAVLAASELAGEPDADVERIGDHLTLDLLRMVAAGDPAPASH